MMKPGAPVLLLLATALAFSGCGSSSSGAGGGGTGGGTGGSGGTGTGGAGAVPDASAGGGGAAAGEDGGAGTGGSGAGGSVGSSVAMMNFVETYAAAYCQRIQQCCMPAGFDAESCQNGMKGIADIVVMSYQPYLTSGKATYRPDKAAACINTLLGAGCSDVQHGSAALNDVIDACAVAFVSAVAPGGACMDDLECQAGWCDPNTMKCIAKKADGAACEDDGDCLSDNCSTNSMTCLPRGIEGLCP